MFEPAFRYKCWADARTVGAVARIDSVKQAAAHDFLLQQLNHMTIVEELFKARLLQQQEPHAATNSAQVPTFEALRERNALSNAWYLDYLLQLAPAELDTSLVFTFADGQPGEMTRSEVLFHVVNHGSYHRGSMSRALDLAGVPHPVDGYAKYRLDAGPQTKTTLRGEIPTES